MEKKLTNKELSDQMRELVKEGQFQALSKHTKRTGACYNVIKKNPEVVEIDGLRIIPTRDDRD